MAMGLESVTEADFVPVSGEHAHTEDGCNGIRADTNSVSEVQTSTVDVSRLQQRVGDRTEDGSHEGSSAAFTSILEERPAIQNVQLTTLTDTRTDHAQQYKMEQDITNLRERVSQVNRHFIVFWLAVPRDE